MKKGLVLLVDIMWMLAFVLVIMLFYIAFRISSPDERERKLSGEVANTELETELLSRMYQPIGSETLADYIIAAVEEKNEGKAELVETILNNYFNSRYENWFMTIDDWPRSTLDTRLRATAGGRTASIQLPTRTGDAITVKVVVPFQLE